MIQEVLGDFIHPVTPVIPSTSRASDKRNQAAINLCQSIQQQLLVGLETGLLFNY